MKPITEHLADMLRERSARGLEKYGTSIDRGDLSAAEWLQHLLEELLDAAQYVEAAKRQAQANAPLAALPDPMPPTTLDMPLTREQREVEDAFRRGWNSCRATVMLAADTAQAPKPEPHGYAYRYPGPYGGIRFNGGEEVNGGRPIEAIPYWLGSPPAPQPQATDNNKETNG